MPFLSLAKVESVDGSAAGDGPAGGGAGNGAAVPVKADQALKCVIGDGAEAVSVSDLWVTACRWLFQRKRKAFGRFPSG